MIISHSSNNCDYKLEKTEIHFVSHFVLKLVSKASIQGIITTLIVITWSNWTLIGITWPKLTQKHPDIYKYPIYMPNYQ